MFLVCRICVGFGFATLLGGWFGYLSVFTILYGWWVSFVLGFSCLGFVVLAFAVVEFSWLRVLRCGWVQAIWVLILFINGGMWKTFACVSVAFGLLVLVLLCCVWSFGICAGMAYYLPLLVVVWWVPVGCVHVWMFLVVIVFISFFGFLVGITWNL